MKGYHWALTILISTQVYLLPADDNEKAWKNATVELAELHYQHFSKDPKMLTYGKDVVRKMSTCVAEDFVHWGKKFECLYFVPGAKNEVQRGDYLTECLLSNGYDSSYLKRVALLCITKAKQRE